MLGTARKAAADWRWWALLLAVAMIATAIYFIYARQGSAQAEAQAPGKGAARDPAARSVPVAAVAAKTGDIGVYLSGLGSVTPLNTVTVKSRVDGQLVKVLFREGQVVRAGERLAQIDPRPFEVQLAQAQGQLERDRALLRNAQIDLERYETLLKQDSIAEQQVSTQKSLVAQYEGAVRVDQAAVDNARLQLTYSNISSPISGRLGLRLVDEGNMVHASDTTGLVVITQLQPITVVFSLPEDNLPEVLKRLHAGERLTVDAYDRDQKNKLATGQLLTIDNQIDPTTGTVRLKATFDNQDGVLFPNQFVNARLLLRTERDATLIPTAAVQRGAQGPFVYVVKPDQTVGVRPVTVGATRGDEAAISNGIAPGELVVVDGADKLRDGAKVEVQTGAPQAPRKRAKS